MLSVQDEASGGLQSLMLPSWDKYRPHQVYRISRDASDVRIRYTCSFLLLSPPHPPPPTPLAQVGHLLLRLVQLHREALTLNLLIMQPGLNT